jgi:hypothetical protein
VTEPQPSPGAPVAPDDDGVLAGLRAARWVDTFQGPNGLLTMDRRPRAGRSALARARRGEGDDLT